MSATPRLFDPGVEEGLALARRVDPKYRPVWAGRPAAQQAALAWYFLPHRSAKPLLGPTRPRAVKWYCPFADQRAFASGHRYCLNVYTGCGHGCVYCYAAGYASMGPRPKADFRRLLRRDMDDLEAFDVPPAPVHLSNSTDLFQPLEARYGDARAALEQILAHRHRFTTVTVLTKNPSLAASAGYLGLLRELSRLPANHGKSPGPARPEVLDLCVEVSLAFWRRDVAAAYDPGAPPVADRIDGIARLRSAGIPVILRLSPLYPLGDGGAAPQTLRDVRTLVRLAADLGVASIVYTPGKIVRPKHGRLHPLMASMLRTYRRLAGPQRLDFRGGSWRLPAAVARKHVVAPLLAACEAWGVPAAFCKRHLVETT